jgi:hypothetical protein
MGNFKNKEVTFAVGTGRCGTNFLHKVLKGEPGTASHHERSAFNDTFHRYCKWYDLPVDNAGFLEVKRAGIAEDLEANERSFESSAFLSLSIQELYEAFDAKFVLLVRAPEKVVNSYIKKGWYRDYVFQDDPDKIPSYQPDMKEFHHFLGRTLPRGEEYERWKNYSRVGKLAWYWETLNARVLQQFEHIPESHKRIEKIEELDFGRFEKLCEFIGFKPKIRKTSYDSIVESKPNRIGRVKRLDDWNDAQIAEFQDEVADMANHFGYGINLKTMLDKEPPPSSAPGMIQRLTSRIFKGWKF